jgi:4-amino-4-deoxy-L-arabinose transferase-like glycosyltransferase
VRSVSVGWERLAERSKSNTAARRAGLWSWVRAHAYAITAGALVAFGTLLRAVLAALGWFPVDSDESVFGLMALHIAYRGEHPIWYYGQQYMGALEGYIAAASFRLFGVSPFTLRLGLILLFACFLVMMYLLASLLYSKKLALISLALLSLGSAEIMERELETSGHFDTLPFGALLLLLATWLALSFERDSSATRRFWRTLAYVVWGLAAGLGLWSDFLIAPFIATAGLLLIVFCWRELLGGAALGLLAGLLVGAYPLIAYNWAPPPGQSTLQEVWYVQHAAIPGQPSGLTLLTRQVEGALFVSLPLATGAHALCALPVHDLWPLSARSSQHAIQCTAAHAGWAVGFLALLAISALLAMRGLWKGWAARRRSQRRTWMPDERREAVRQFGRLMMVATVVPIIGLVADSPATAVDPWGSKRYLMSLLIALPAVIAPLCWAIGLRRAPRERPLALRALGYTGLLIIGAVLLAGTVDVFGEIPGAQQVVAQQQQVNATLERLGSTRIYSEYWTCNRVIFQTREQIVCAVLNDDLSPGQDRYMLYPALVQAAKHPAYVFPLASPQAAAFARKIARSRARYQRLVLDGYVIYTPVTRAGT